jgi:YHS domain-containing protein
MIVSTSKPKYVDPVCQMKVTKGGRVSPFTFQSDTYYFCAEACRDAFKSDPDKYLRARSVKKKGLWGRYLDRLNKVTGGKPPCCH